MQVPMRGVGTGVHVEMDDRAGGSCREERVNAGSSQRMVVVERVVQGQAQRGEDHVGKGNARSGESDGLSA